MVFLIDSITVIIPLLITYALYRVYYQIFIMGYIKRIKKALDDGETEKAEQMKQYALKKQPKKMHRILTKYGV